LDTDAGICFTSIAPLIRKVVIIASGYSDIPTSWRHIQSFPPAHVEQMRSIVAALPDLERAVIRAIKLGSVGTAFILAGLTDSVSRELHLINVDFAQINLPLE
jgi:hypothetical protein